MNRKLLLFLALLLLVAIAVGLSLQFDVIEVVRARMQQLDTRAAGMVFILAFALASILLLPNSVLMILGGAYFGLLWGTLFNLAGFILGAAGAFLISRYLAHDYIKARIPRRFDERMRHVHASGWKFVALLRVSGLLPSVVLNYAFGVTPVRFSAYAWASAVFTVPICFVFTYAGVAGEEFISSGNLQAALTALLVVALGAVLAWFMRKRFIR